jgi:hypothetical protein
MKDLAKKAAREGVEYGAAISADWKLINPVRGSQRQVTIPRPAGAKGSFHTHRLEAQPSLPDLWEMASHQEGAMCIGTARVALPEVRCLYPQRKEDFRILGLAVRLVEERERDYIQRLESRYGKAEARTDMEKAEGLDYLRGARRVKEIIEKRWPEIIYSCALE